MLTLQRSLKTAVVVLLALTISTAYADPGEFDDSFSDDGLVLQGSGGDIDDEAEALAASGQKVVVIRHLWD